MNWAQFKDLFPHMCLAGAVTSWALTQEVAGWEVRAFLLSWQTFRKNFNIPHTRSFYERKVYRSFHERKVYRSFTYLATEICIILTFKPLNIIPYSWAETE